MIILALPIFVSLMLLFGALVLYIFTVRSATFDHSDRLALLPLEPDGKEAPSPTAEESRP